MTQVAAPDACSARAEALRPGELRIEPERLGDGTYVVRLIGDVDMYTAPRLAAILHQASAEATSVVVDLTKCSFIDSTGLGVLVATNKRFLDSGRRLALVASDRRVLGYSGCSS